MASIPHTVLTSDKVGSTQEISGKVFFSKDGLDQPCDITLVVRDGEFKAHRKVLSEASPFFEKLLNSDMKECKEGVVRLEIFTDSVMRSTLAFIYTGNVQILDEDEARDLIMLADYLLQPNLKILAAQVLFKKCNISNFISIFRFADEYHCEELVSKTKTFTLSNFTTIFTHNRENVLRMSIKELTMLISRDELHVSTEEDVFNIILAWIHHAKRKRQNYFAELFRHVRLLHISRDFLSNDVVTNEFVKGNKGCLDLVHKAIGTLDSKNFDNLPDNLHYTPRKVFESSVLITYSQKYLMCFFPRENSRYTLGDERPSESRASRIFSCNSKLYSTRIGSVEYPQDICRLPMSCYERIGTLGPCYQSQRETHVFGGYLSTIKMKCLLCSWNDVVGITIVVGGFEMEEDTKNVSSADDVPRKEPKRNMFPSLCDINLNYTSGKKSHLSIIWI